jgi:histidyl-tRNA synthetase
MEKPSLPKGTRDFGPAAMAKRQFIFNNIRSVFEKFGFQPLETPAMENLATLTGKYGEEGDQLLFKILNSGDFLKDVPTPKLQARESKSLTIDISEKGLRYDLTVPFARYVVMNRSEITFPFKRYQIQPVWRADRPQKGRYREFYQCDADVVGTSSLICEAEIILMIKETCKRLGIQDYTIKINHRGILGGIAGLIGAQGNETALFVAIDKLDKIGEEKVKEELRSKGFTDESLSTLFSALNVQGSNTNKIAFLLSKFENIETGKKGLRELKEVFLLLEHALSDDQHVEFDVALARGLSYYTGCIFEVKINNVTIGSVSGGGRYDNLTQAFGDKENLSGVGFSFGVDRIYDAMEELNLFPKETQISSKILICHLDSEGMNYGLGLLARLRNADIPSEIYPEQAKVKKQLEYGNRKLIPFTAIIGSEEMATGLIALKNMTTGTQEKLTAEDIIAKLK